MNYIYSLIVCMLLLNLPVYGMKSEKKPSLDHEWTWEGAPRLREVINTPTRKDLRSSEKIHVAVVDEYVNFAVCPLSKDSDIAPWDYDFRNKDHGTHVANTIRKICPSVRIHSYGVRQYPEQFVDSINKAANNNKIDIINISQGPRNSSGLESWKRGEDIYQAILAATQKGKIVINSAGNSYFEDYHDDYVDALIAMSKDENMMGRMVFVLNSKYKKNTDKLNEFSNRPEKYFRRVITAPGTDITALTRISTVSGENRYETKSGTSMAAPIVTGVIAQLLSDFSRKRKQFVLLNSASMHYLGEHLFLSDKGFKGMILKGALDNARKVGLDGEKLGPRFGQGVIDYGNAYGKIQELLNAKLDEISEKLGTQMEEKERKERELEEKKTRKENGRSNRK